MDEHDCLAERFEESERTCAPWRIGFTMAGGLITRIDLISDPEHLRKLHIATVAS